MKHRASVLWFVIMIGGAVAIAMMGFVLTNSIIQSRQQGYVTLGHGDVLVVESKSEVRIVSEEGAETCLIPVGSSSYTPVLCTEEYLGKYYFAWGHIEEGEYLIQGKMAIFYLPDSQIPDKYGMMARQLIGVTIIVVFYLLLTAYLYFKLR